MNEKKKVKKSNVQPSIGAEGRDVEGRGGGDAVFCVIVARPTEGRETPAVFCACFCTRALRARWIEASL